MQTATSSFLGTYDTINKPLPAVGSHSLVTNGRGALICVVEPLAVALQEGSLTGSTQTKRDEEHHLFIPFLSC